MGIKLEINEEEYKKYVIKSPTQPIGFLYHKPTMTNIFIYKKINWFQRLMLRICFGLEYTLYSNSKPIITKNN